VNTPLDYRRAPAPNHWSQLDGDPHLPDQWWIDHDRRMGLQGGPALPRRRIPKREKIGCLGMLSAFATVFGLFPVLNALGVL
jgi:hypothetical protein